MLLLNGVLVPSEVLLSLVVGEPPVFQHTPSAVMEAPPFDETVPPLVAVFKLKLVILVVVTVGVVTDVVKLDTAP